MLKRPFFVVFITFIVLFSGCSVVSPDSNSGGSSRYDQEFDTGPTKTVDVESIPHILPQPVVRTRAGNYSPYEVLGKTYTVLPDSHNFVEQGLASWYGTKFHGQLTSNGERFDMYGMTAAHKSLPIPTYVEVTNLDNGLTAILRVNDRGPFHGNRVIDLSWAAAAKLGYADKGTANVRIVALDANAPQATLLAVDNLGKELGIDSTTAPMVAPKESIPDEYLLPPKSYYQIARLTQKESAIELSDEVGTYVKLPVVIAEQERNGAPSYLILIGPISDRRDANELALILELAGQSSGFITTLSVD